MHLLHLIYYIYSILQFLLHLIYYIYYILQFTGVVLNLAGEGYTALTITVNNYFNNIGNRNEDETVTKITNLSQNEICKVVAITYTLALGDTTKNTFFGNQIKTALFLSQYSGKQLVEFLRLFEKGKPAWKTFYSNML